MLGAMARRGSTERLLALSACVVVFHVLTSVVQEAVFYLPGFHHTGLLTFAQALFISLFAGAKLYRSSPVTSALPWRRLLGARRVSLTTYFMISLMNTTSVYLTNEASRLLSFSTQVVFKSSKLLVVWLVRYIAIELPERWDSTNADLALEKDAADAYRHTTSAGHAFHEKVCECVILSTPSSGVAERVPQDSSAEIGISKCGSVYSSIISTSVSMQNSKNTDSNTSSRAAERHFNTVNEVVSCITIALGLIVFTYAAASTHKAEGAWAQKGWWPLIAGVSGIVIALLCDALMYLGEEKYCFMKHNASHDEVQFYIFLLSSLNGFVSLVLGGGVVEAAEFVCQQQMFIVLLLLCSFCSYGGTMFILRIVSEFNSSTATMVTSVRRMLTILCSYIIYPKPFRLSHLVGVLLVMGGVWRYEVARKASSALLKTDKEHTVSTEGTEDVSK